MTAKRFTETLSTGIVTDNVTGKEYKCEMRIDDDLLKLLNELHETIHRLKQNIDELLSVNVEEELLKENEQLKQQLTGLNIPIDEVKEVVVDYKGRVERVYYND